EDVSRSLGVGVERFKSQVVTPLQEVGQRFEAGRSVLEQKVSEHAQTGGAMLENHRGALGAAFDHHRAMIGAAFDRHGASLAETAKQSAEDFDARVSAVADAA